MRRTRSVVMDEERPFLTNDLELSRLEECVLCATPLCASFSRRSKGRPPPPRRALFERAHPASQQNRTANVANRPSASSMLCSLWRTDEHAIGAELLELGKLLVSIRGMPLVTLLNRN